MLKQWPPLDITCSKWYHVRAQACRLKSYFIHSARDKIEELNDLHHFACDAEHLEFIDSLLADNKYLFLVAEHVEGGEHSPSPTQRESKAAHVWPALTLLPGGTNHGVTLHQILSSGE